MPPPTTQKQQHQATHPSKSTFHIHIRILLPPPSPSSLSSSSPQHLLSNQPLYLSPNGSTTTSKSLAALCHLSHSTRLYCGNFVTPISAPVNAPAALFSSVRGSARGGLESGVVSLGFEISGREGSMVWRGGEGKREVKWVVRVDGEGGAMSVWAVFRDDSVRRESVGVELMVDYEV
ncbi:hypothetical protein DL98DRAFT_650645 [Cadophora sp. DSE1049]|nr:hypothetical protein DL98DRAFT_650645 [Cadophora sp. DSE1049]